MINRLIVALFLGLASACALEVEPAERCAIAAPDADLRCARLVGADLFHEDCDESDLSRAGLNKASLFGTNLNAARAVGADFY